jgi:hypothetical protein
VALSGDLLEDIVVALSGDLLEDIVVALSGDLLEDIVVALSGAVELILFILSVQSEFMPIRALVIILVIQSVV